MKRRIEDIMRLLRDPQALQQQHPAFLIALQTEALLMQVMVMREALGYGLGAEDEDEDEEEVNVEQPEAQKVH